MLVPRAPSRPGRDGRAGHARDRAWSEPVPMRPLRVCLVLADAVTRKSSEQQVEAMLFLAETSTRRWNRHIIKTR